MDRGQRIFAIGAVWASLGPAALGLAAESFETAPAGLRFRATSEAGGMLDEVEVAEERPMELVAVTAHQPVVPVLVRIVALPMRAPRITLTRRTQAKAKSKCPFA